MGFDTDEANRIATEVGIPDHSCFRGTHAGPALQRKLVLVHDGPHHFADVERLLASGIRLVGENLTYRGETLAAVGMRIEPDVALDGVGGHGLARKTFARSQVGVIVVT